MRNVCATNAIRAEKDLRRSEARYRATGRKSMLRDLPLAVSTAGFWTNEAIDEDARL